MPRILRPGAPLFALCLLCGFSPDINVNALLITTETHGLGTPGYDRRIIVTPQMVRAETRRAVLIYDAERDHLWKTDDERHEYVDMRQQRQRRLRSVEDIRTRLPGMTEAERKAAVVLLEFADFLRSDSPMSAWKGISYVRSGAKRTVNNWICEEATIVQDGHDVNEVCIIALSNLGIDADEVRRLKNVEWALRFISSSSIIRFFPLLGGLNYDAMTTAIDNGDFVIRSVIHSGSGVQITEVKSIQRVILPIKTFEIPESYVLNNDNYR